MGTGHGSGYPVAYGVYKDRDPLDVCTYSGQLSMLYSTPIYIWDKENRHKLVKPKEKMPPVAAIQDTVPSTPEQRQSTVSSPEELLIQTIKKFSAERNRSFRELKSTLDSEAKSGSENVEDLISSIEKIKNQMIMCVEEIASLSSGYWT